VNELPTKRPQPYSRGGEVNDSVHKVITCNCWNLLKQGGPGYNSHQIRSPPSTLGCQGKMFERSTLTCRGLLFVQHRLPDPPSRSVPSGISHLYLPRQAHSSNVDRLNSSRFLSLTWGSPNSSLTCRSRIFTESIILLALSLLIRINPRLSPPQSTSPMASLARFCYVKEQTSLIGSFLPLRLEHTRTTDQPAISRHASIMVAATFRWLDGSIVGRRLLEAESGALGLQETNSALPHKNLSAIL
jgi:hypothetical protein